MATTKENPIISYDILSEHGTWSPNTYKTRLTLNYKRLPYRVEYISYPDIAPKLELGVRATNPNPYIAYTLPMIADPSPDQMASQPTLWSHLILRYTSTKPTQAQNTLWNEVLLAILPCLAPLTVRAGFLDVRGREYYLKTREELLKRIPTDTSVGSKLWGDAHEKWRWFGEVLDLNEEGPFVTGKQISFADFAVGGVLSYLRRVEAVSEGEDMPRWKAITEWQGGRWARLWAEIEKLENDSTEVA